MSEAKPIHILMFVPCLGGGGAEKHLVRLANALDRSSFRVSIAVNRGGGSYEAELSSDVTLYDLACKRMLFSILPLRRLVKKLRPDVVFSVMDHANCINVLATCFFTGSLRARAAFAPTAKPLTVLGVQLPPAVDAKLSPNWKRRILLALTPILYNRADSIVALSSGVKSDLIGIDPRLEPKIDVIYNAGVDASLLSSAAQTVPLPQRKSGEFILLGCGRLTEQKGFSYLLAALADLLTKLPVSLWLLGEGHLREDLQRQAARLGIAENVLFLGFKKNPFAFMKAADVFVLSSLWEGFGNVVVEAMAVGTPVVATACPYGPDEIITTGANGLLVPVRDSAALSAAIEQVLTQPQLRKNIQNAALERASYFSAENIAREYGALFLRLRNSSRADTPIFSEARA